MVLILLLACGADPVWDDRRAAITAFEAGQVALESGQPDDASTHFAEALALQPGDPVLIAWQARAEAERGEDEAAARLYRDALRIHPGLAAARYNRAAVLVRLGRTDAAALELKRSIDDGAARSRDVLDDPDFASVLDLPPFDFLPAASLTVAVDGPSEAVFWGSEALVSLRVLGARERVVKVEAEEVSGPLELIRVTESVGESSDNGVVDLVWTAKVVGAGPVQVGPFRVWTGSAEGVEIEPVRFDAIAPPDKRDGPSADWTLTTPRMLMAGREAPAVWRGGDRLFAYAEGTDKVQTEPSMPLVPYVLREHGALAATVYEMDSPDSVRVTIFRRGVEQLSEELPGSEEAGE